MEHRKRRSGVEKEFFLTQVLFCKCSPDKIFFFFFLTQICLTHCDSTHYCALFLGERRRGGVFDQRDSYTTLTFFLSSFVFTSLYWYNIAVGFLTIQVHICLCLSFEMSIASKTIVIGWVLNTCK